MTLENGRLFDGPPLAAWLSDRRQTCLKELQQLPIKDLLETPVEMTAESLLGTHRVTPLALRRDSWRMDEVRETSVYGKGGLVESRVRSFSGHPGPGYSTTVRVPFDGDPDLLFLAVPGASGPPPVGFPGSSELNFRFEWPRDEQPSIDRQMESLLDSIESPHLEAQTREIEASNRSLEAEVSAELISRRDGYLKAQQYLADLPIPVYPRSDAPQTYAAPGIERRPAPQVGERKPGEPLEPILAEDFYEHIVRVVSAMARGMERTPGDYRSWEEEKLRDALLVILNTHYTGGATGETFNSGGKVDILVRVTDRNVFVGECKWWSGSKSFADPETGESALDQLLSYTTWRDGKLALAVFVKNKELEPVVDSAQAKLQERGDVSSVRRRDDGQLRAEVELPAGGTANLAVVFVHLPDAPPD
jgi:hypothetical protein